MALANSVSGGALLWTVIILISGAVLVYSILSIERYIRMHRTLAWIVGSFKYTLCGAGVSAAGYGLYIVCEVLASAGTGINPVHVVGGVAIYVGVTLLGWSAVNVYRSLQKMRTQYRDIGSKLPDQNPPSL
jgi:hypothetical protein